MASLVIPEFIAGHDLFAPDAYNQFSIEAAGLPNGDDCLVIHGDVSNNYKAFVRTPILNPDALRKHAGNEPWAMSFWIKAPSGSKTSIATDMALFGVSTINGLPSQGVHSGALWTVSAFGTSDIYFARGCQSGGGAYVMTFPASGVRDGNWHFVVINTGTGNTSIDQQNGESYVDNSTTPSGSDGVTSSNVQPGPEDELYFCIGSYGKNATSFNEEWRLGKLTLHDHHLNATERAALYNAMMA